MNRKLPLTRATYPREPGQRIRVSGKRSLFPEDLQMNGKPTARELTSEGMGHYWGLLMAAVVLAISQWVCGEAITDEAVGNMSAVGELLSNEYEVVVG